jgi:hypothetical protein
MDRTSLHREIRNALSAADELSRHEHGMGDDDLAGSMAALRSALADLERDVGRSHEDDVAPDPDTVAFVERSLESLIVRRHQVPAALRSRTEQLLASAERISNALWDPTARVASKPLLGMLPIARLLPQDGHSLLDYAHAAGFLVSAKLARTGRARAVGLALGAGVGGVSLVTDHRLGAAKVLPIEVHESVDYAVGLTAVAAPFLLGYAKTDPIAAMLQVGLGVGTLLTSLLSDYRASKGVTWPRRSNGGPKVAAPRAPGGERGVRVSDVQRPLEGLSSAPSDWEGAVGESKPSF